MAWANLSLVGGGWGSSRSLGWMVLDPRVPLVWRAVHSFFFPSLPLPPFPFLLPWMVGDELQPLEGGAGWGGGVSILKGKEI